ncbi:GntR family transcriptional regulator [Georgenia alba]|uniref:GntR family transcriptional regulator n=1 Tax=Georgenia alba TaxID=2233858 RepID=A0ABW2Q2F5_9MICO
MSSPLAAHARIRGDLERAIRAGQYPAGSTIPTERVLAEQYGVSRATVQRAVTDMARAGLVVRRRRAGTVVAPGGAGANLLHFTNLAAEGPEVHGGHRVVRAEVVPREDIAEELPGVAPNAAVVVMERIKEDEHGTASAVERSYIPFEVAPRVLREDLGTLTTLAYFRRAGIAVARSRLYVTPTIAGAEDAASLAIEPGRPLFHLRRETYLANGRIAEVLSCALSPDSFRLFVEQTLDPTPTEETT